MHVSRTSALTVANNTTTRADFKSCQDRIVDQRYYTPSINLAKRWGLTKALSKAALFDAYINHGESGIVALISATNSALGNSAQVAPAVGYNCLTESSWLRRFLEKRRDVLKNDSTWVESVDRVARAQDQPGWDVEHAGLLSVLV
ncbi:chitosanase [Hyalangium gracile]|uniref:chitosanase n=1 Tax=Hyalangium gracile TaxID=394092 RepID=UPI001CCEB7FB|nr:chitosanase [Hyalangium gracile]